MVVKGFEGDCRVRGHQLVTMAILTAALASGALVRIASAAEGPTIFVSNVDDLYAAVNDAANAGAAVVLAPGVYTLSTKDAGGVPRPNGGRLHLQTDMSLFGVVGERSAVVIDGSLLLGSLFTVPWGRTGIINVGLGSNAIEWLTIAGNPAAAAAIETDLVATDEDGTPIPTTIRIAHVVAGGRLMAGGTLDIEKASARGVDIRNIGTAGGAGRRIDAEIVDSEVFGGVEGIRFVNLNAAHYSEINVAMRGNRSHTNRLGCIFENNRSNHASISVRSNGDRFEDNGLGCQIGGGLAVTPGQANFNNVTFDARGSAFVDNTLTDFSKLNATGPLFTDLGGLLVAGGDLVPIDTTSAVSGNTVVIRLWGSKIAGNQVFDFEAFGARSPTSLNATDTHVLNNQVLIELHGVSRFIEVSAFDSKLPDLTGTNTVTVVRKP